MLVEHEYIQGGYRLLKKKARTIQEHSITFQEHNFRKIIAFKIIIYIFFIPTEGRIKKLINFSNDYIYFLILLGEKQSSFFSMHT